MEQLANADNNINTNDKIDRIKVNIEKFKNCIKEISPENQKLAKDVTKRMIDLYKKSRQLKDISQEDIDKVNTWTKSLDAYTKNSACEVIGLYCMHILHKLDQASENDSQSKDIDENEKKFLEYIALLNINTFKKINSSTSSLENQSLFDIGNSVLESGQRKLNKALRNKKDTEENFIRKILPILKEDEASKMQSNTTISEKQQIKALVDTIYLQSLLFTNEAAEQIAKSEIPFGSLLLGNEGNENLKISNKEIANGIKYFFNQEDQFKHNQSFGNITTKIDSFSSVLTYICYAICNNIPLKYDFKFDNSESERFCIEIQYNQSEQKLELSELKKKNSHYEENDTNQALCKPSSKASSLVYIKDLDEDSLKCILKESPDKLIKILFSGYRFLTPPEESKEGSKDNINKIITKHQESNEKYEQLFFQLTLDGIKAANNDDNLNVTEKDIESFDKKKFQKLSKTYKLDTVHMLNASSPSSSSVKKPFKFSEQEEEKKEARNELSKPIITKKSINQSKSKIKSHPALQYYKNITANTLTGAEEKDVNGM